jgi:hypothetical protein
MEVKWLLHSKVHKTSATITYKIAILSGLNTHSSNNIAN